MQQMFKSKKAVFRDLTRAFTVGNITFGIVMIMVVTFFVNYVLFQLFDIELLKLGQAFRLLIIGLSVIITFYTISRKQGSLDRQDILYLLLVGGASFALIYYLPTLVPEIFSIKSTNPLYSTFQLLNVTASGVHNAIQAVIPIP